MKNRRNSETCILDQPLLNGVGEFRRAAGVVLFSLPGELADPVRHSLLGELRRKIAAIGHLFTDAAFIERPFVPERHHLGDLFLQGHPRKQVAYTLVDRKPRIFVRRSLLSTRRDRQKSGNERNEE